MTMPFNPWYLLIIVGDDIIYQEFLIMPTMMVLISNNIAIKISKI